MKRPTLLAIAVAVVLSASAYARDSYQIRMEKALAEVTIPQGYSVGTYMEFETLQSGDLRLLDVITPGLRNAPLSDLETLMGGETRLAASNYSAVIDRLFLGDDVASWYSPSSAAETYRQSLQKEYERLRALPSTQTPKQFQNVLDAFNYGLGHASKTPPRFSKEGLRRLLISSAFVPRYLEDEKVKTNKSAVEQIVAYLILSDARPLAYFTLTSHSGTDVYRMIVPDLSQLQTSERPLHDLAGKQEKIDNFFEKGVKRYPIKMMIADIELAESEKRLKDSEVRLKDSEVRLKDSEVRLKDSEVRLKDSEVRLAEEQRGLAEEQAKGKAYKTIIKFQELANQELKTKNRYLSSGLMSALGEAKQAIEYLKTLQERDPKVGEVIALVEPLIRLMESRQQK